MIVSLADMKTYLGISETTHDSFLTSQLQLISDVVETYCRRIFASANYVQTYYRDENRWNTSLQTFHWPLSAVASIVEDGVTLDSSLYRLNKPSGVITRPKSFFFQAQATVVSYTAGFSATPTPVVNVVMTCVEERYNKKLSGVDLNFGSDVQRISIPGAISIDFDYTLNNNDRKNDFGMILGSTLNVLDYYRNDRSIIGSDKLIYVAAGS